MAKAKQRTSLNPLDYMGVEPGSPSNFSIQTRNPASSDYNGYNIGDEWLNSNTQNTYKLVNKAGLSATWVLLGGSATSISFDTDSGIATTSGGTINMDGSTNIHTTGAGNTVTTFLNTNLTGLGTVTATNFHATGSLTLDFATNGVLQTDGSGHVSATSGSDGQLLISSSVGVPTWANITSLGGTIAITNGHHTINLETNTDVAITYNADAGSATPAAGALTLAGGTGITTSGAGSTVTFNLTSPVTVAHGGTSSTSLTQYNVLVGNNTSAISTIAPSATSGVPLISQGAASNPAYGTAVVAGGGTGATTLTSHGVLVGAGTSAVSGLTAGTNGQVLIGSTGANPAFSTLTSSDGSVTFTTGAHTLDLKATGGGGGGGALVFIAKQLASSVTSITFTSGITATYNNYFLLFDSLGPYGSGVGSCRYWLQLSTDGGATYINTGYNDSLTYIEIGIASSTDFIIGGYQYLYNLTSGFSLITTEGRTRWVRSVSGTASTTQEGGAYAAGSIVCNAFKIFTSNGSTFSGNFTLYGYTES